MKIFKVLFFLFFAVIIGCDNSDNSDNSGNGRANPAVDITGYWAVQSVQNGENRVGMSYYVTMESDGTLSGKVKLTSLPGESSLTGVLEGYGISITCVSQHGTLSASGSVDDTGTNLSGTFSVYSTDGSELKDVAFSGVKVLPDSTISGTYTYNPLDSEDFTIDLTLNATSTETNPINFDVRSITSDTMITWDDYDNGIEWTRAQGTGDGLLGTWEQGTISEMERITFDENNNFSYEHYTQFYLTPI